jgi:hypothetical protein
VEIVDEYEPLEEGLDKVHAGMVTGQDCCIPDLLWHPFLTGAKRREWMGCWGLLGVAGMIITSDDWDHSRQFPAFSTSKIYRKGHLPIKQSIDTSFVGA